MVLEPDTDPGAMPTESVDVTRSIEPAESTQPRQIGPYQLGRKLGEGGMGQVYEAEQQEPVRRKVALKLIKWGMDTRRVVARFEAERQALALMNHPSIARVYDAGATEQGRPYFVMELVKGVPITDYCDRHQLSTRERLELFALVCEGVQHAHQKGIIHRDIKPSNVLATIQDDKPVPKIIDFGVAKATEQRLTEKTVFTELGQLVGTPAYMSPEQAEMTGLDIDTRTDVYSLGVLLYELLSGALPFDPRDLRRAGYDEIRRRIREDEPAKPSTRISSLGEAATAAASNRATAPAALVRRLRGDLDWISMKALEKDRTRRYGSPADLAADVARHLQSEPVLAGPPSAAYKAKKFVRRHRIGVTAAGVVLAALVLGVVGTTFGMVRARQQARRAEASNLFALGREILEDNPSGALAYAAASLELADDPDVREFAIETLWQGPTAIESERLGEYALSLNFGPRGHRLAAGGWQGLHKLWTSDGTLLLGGEESESAFDPNGVPAYGHGNDELVYVDFSGDGRFHVSSSDRGVRVWSVGNARELRFIDIQPWWLGVRGQKLLTLTPTGDGRSVRIQRWPLEEGEAEEAGTWNRPDALSDGLALLRVDVDATGEWLAYAEGPDLHLLRLGRAGVDAQLHAGRGTGRITRVCFHPDGERIATLERGEGDDVTIRFWSGTNPTPKPLRSFEASFPEFTDAPAALGQTIRFDPEGRWMVVITQTDRTLLWDLSAPAGSEPLVLRKVDGRPMDSASVHPSGTWLALAQNTLSLWPLTRTYAHGLSTDCRDVVFGPDGDWIVSGSWGGTVRLWSLDPDAKEQGRILVDTTDVAVIGLAVSPDGQSVAAGLWDGRVLIVPVSGGAVRELAGFTSGLFAVDFDRAGRRVAAAGQKKADDSVIRVWDLESGHVEVLDPGDRRGIMSLQFAPDGRLLSGGAGALLLWDLEAGTKEVLLPGATDARLGPQGRYVLAMRPVRDEGISSSRWTASVYDLRERRSWKLASHGDRLFTASWHPDGRHVVTGSEDGIVRVGPLTGEEPHLLIGHRFGVAAMVDVDPRGKWIASCGKRSGAASSLKLWAWPEGRPLQTLPHDEFLAHLESLTNYRVVRGDESITGYRLDVGSFPGWVEPPVW
jgi:serine/threonine protein kinase/WD40 repeat protein